MKSILSTIALCSLLMACSQNNQPPKTDTSAEPTNNAAQHTQSIYAPYSKEEVEAKVQ
jgi:hypothetical protein